MDPAALTAAPRPLHILVVANLYPSVRSPAFGTFVAARVAALRRAGHVVTVTAITDDRVHRGIGRKYLRLALRALAIGLASRLRGPRPDIVEAHIAFPTGLLAWPVARLTGARLVLFCHGSDVTRLPWVSARRTRLARWLFGRADLVVANSRFVADVAETRLGPLRRPAVVASPGVRVPQDTPAGDVRVPGSVVFVGRLVPGKGVDVLVEAMATLCRRVPDAHLQVVGDGPLRSELEARAEASGAPVRFLGPLPPDEVASILARSAAAAVPSTADEGLGLVALEAMANGALVAATAVGGLAETIRDGENGRVVAAGDPEALATALASLLADRTSTAGTRMRAAGRATAAEHDIDAVVAASLVHERELLSR